MPRLFSYGSLQQATVQQSAFGRRLDGQPDALPGYETHDVRHGDRALTSIRRRADHRVAGTVFEISDQELRAADAYEEGDSYARRAVKLASGLDAWVYVDSATVD